MKWVVVAVVGLFCGLVQAQEAKIAVQVDRPGITVSPTLYGIFFEEIGRAGDGGIYAEMVQNRSFEDDKKPVGWSVVKSGEAEGAIALDASRPLNGKNPHSMRIEISKAGGRFGVANEGFKGIAVRKDAQYNLTLYACAKDFSGAVTVSLESADGASVYASQKIEGVGGEWKQFAAALTASGSDANARLVVAASNAGTIWVDMVSLFPKETFKGHGFRSDLGQMLSDMHPAFVRFPGGCYVEGDVLKDAFRWKNTIGDVAQRPGHWNLWGYYSNDGLGYHEYLQLCEDIGAEPMYVINCGMAHKDHVPMDKMDEYVQDALDAIEYANGPVESTWGAMRAKAGHPAPFNMKLFEIGNENGGPIYHERYVLFHDAIKAKYPYMKLVANQWNGIPKNRTLDIIDEHYYSTPEFFIGRFKQYDTYVRTGPKIYVGEYAVTQNCGGGNLRGAVGEAVFMCGMERNSDKVAFASYAPLFVHPGWRRWNPNAIVFNPGQSYGIPSYYVQAMFAANRGDVILPLEAASPKVEGAEQGGMVGVGSWLTQVEYKDIKVTQGEKVLFASDFAKGTKGWKLGHGQWSAQDGVLRQTGNDDDCRAIVGDKKWTNYTLSLKARKISGSEGFLIIFGSNGSKAKSWWNIGGWGNTRHSLEMQGLDHEGVAGTIETGRWYDIRVELSGSRVRCFLDDKLIHDVSGAAFDSLYGVAGRSNSTGEVIVKVVNVAAKEMETQIELRGVKSVAKTGTAIVLSSSKGEDENSFEEPTKVMPKTEKLEIEGSSFKHTFPGNSVTIIRVKAE